jgi:SRSO17 transposase
VVSVSSLWADEGVYDPVDFEPDTPAHHFEKGEKDPGFRTKLKIALQLVNRAIEVGIPFGAVVADSFSAEDYSLRQELRARPLAYVLALKPSHDCWQAEAMPGCWVRWHRQRAARALSSRANGSKSRGRFGMDPSKRGGRRRVQAGPYGPDKTERAVIATTDPETLPDIGTW